MRVLLSWLREYVDLPFGVDELAERLQMLGLGHESVQRVGDDAVMDLEIPANRGDLMSHLGVAREVAAATRSTIRFPAGAVPAPPIAASESVRVDVQAPELCPRFTAVLIADVRVGPSPEWVARRLEACGVRSINNVVDVTNYVMLEMGQPMHVFDYDRLRGGRLVVRRAHPGERLTTLDGVDRELDPQTLVVADAERASGVAGIIGGGESEINSVTRRVLLEAASWNPPMIRRTSRRLGVRTESSSRFERGIDTGGVLTASARAVRLILETAGGRVLEGTLDVYPAPEVARVVELRWSSVAGLVGLDVSMEEGIVILRSLGFSVQGSERTLRVTVPSFRRDVEREEDLVEEVARHYGYEKIPETMPLEITAQGTRVLALEAEDAARNALVRAGLIEALTISLTNPSALDSLGLPGDHPWRQAVRIVNPLVEDHTHLRTTLLPGLLNVAKVNASRSVTDVQVFEIGRTFHPAPEGVTERRGLAILMMGRVHRGGWNTPPETAAVTYYHLKGAIEALLEELHIAGPAFVAGSSPWLHPGRAAHLTLGTKVIGTLGELHPGVAAGYDLPGAVYVADLDLDALLKATVLRPQYVPLPRFPSVRRDIATIVPQGVPAAQVAETIQDAGGGLLESAELFDVYTGAPVPAGHRNLAYALSFRSPERTLSAEEVDAVLTRITQALEKRLRAKIRE